MPAKSKKQRRAMAIAEHHPEKLYKRNRGLLKMSKEELHDFASTREDKIQLRRKGKPRSNKERKRRHKKRFGTSKLPKRGTGLKRS